MSGGATEKCRGSQAVPSDSDLDEEKEFLALPFVSQTSVSQETIRTSCKGILFLYLESS